MKRVLLSFALSWVLAGTLVFAQEPGGEKLPGDKAVEKALAHEEGKTESAEEKDLSLWRWANFIILAGGLGYLAVKGLGAMFQTRSEEIRKGIAEAQQARLDAEGRAAEIDKRVNALDAEVEKIRSQSSQEMEREGERIRRDTAESIAKIEQQAKVEVESLGIAAQRELKQYAANLAVNLADERLRARMNPAAEGALIDNFLDDLGREGSKQAASRPGSPSGGSVH